MTVEKRIEEICDILWGTWSNGEIPDAEFGRLLDEVRSLHGQSGDPKCLWLLSELYFYRLNACRRNMTSFASRALEAGYAGGHDNFVMGSVGRGWDFHQANAQKTIAFYRDFVRNNPEFFLARRILIELLIGNFRLDEAKSEIAAARPFAGEKGFVLDVHLGEALYRQGERNAARESWQKAAQAHPGVALCHHLLGNAFALVALWEEARDAYERCFALQKTPRRVDALIAIAEIEEILGNHAAAIAAQERILAVLESDYAGVEGLDTEGHLAEIARLKAEMYKNRPC